YLFHHITHVLSPFTVSIFFFLLLRPPPSSTLFPYTTLFRSARASRPSWRSPRCAWTSGSWLWAPPPRRASWCATRAPRRSPRRRSEEHTSELQSLAYLVCRLLLEKKKNKLTKLKVAI